MLNPDSGQVAIFDEMAYLPAISDLD
jgi:hypothetical protein